MGWRWGSRKANIDVNMITVMQPGDMKSEDSVCLGYCQVSDMNGKTLEQTSPVLDVFFFYKNRVLQTNFDILIQLKEIQTEIYNLPKLLF